MTGNVNEIFLNLIAETAHIMISMCLLTCIVLTVFNGIFESFNFFFKFAIKSLA